MALEAWGHRRIDAGERVELVVNDIVADASCSSTVLLTAVDMLLSHWPESADTAVPFIGCPELLCMELGRPGREHIPDFDFFGLKNLQQEPVGLVNCDSLKQRPSRKVSLYEALTSITFGPQERCERVQALLQIASERLSTPKPHSDLGDPLFMALHALNVLDRANWVEIKDSDGNQTGMQYKAPKAEEAHMEPIRQRAAPRLEENALRMAILDELFTKSGINTILP